MYFAMLGIREFMRQVLDTLHSLQNSVQKMIEQSRETEARIGSLETRIGELETRIAHPIRAEGPRTRRRSKRRWLLDAVLVIVLALSAFFGGFILARTTEPSVAVEAFRVPASCRRIESISSQARPLASRVGDRFSAGLAQALAGQQDDAASSVIPANQSLDRLKANADRIRTASRQCQRDLVQAERLQRAQVEQ
jgi:hypothetical protein